MNVRLILTLVLSLLAPTAAMAQLGLVLEEAVAVGMNEPIDLGFLPDGRLLVAEKRGVIKLIDLAQPLGSGTDYLTIDAANEAEWGLTSMVLHPDFANEPYVYLYYLPANGAYFQLSRFLHLGNTADPQSEEVLWVDPDPALACCHYGGGLAFDGAGDIYLATGDKFQADHAQNLERSGGKVLRFHDDGSIPVDNPFVDGPGGVLDEIYALGLRNPFRMSFDATDGRMLVGEVGGNTQATAVEDLHVVEAGANYGWPFCEGMCQLQTYADPVYTIPHLGFGSAIVCGEFLRGGTFPSQFRDRLVIGDYVRGQIRALEFNADGSFASETTLDATAGPIVCLRVGPDGNLYSALFGSNQPIVRHRPVGGNRPPTITIDALEPTSGVGPLELSFTATVSDPEDDPVDVTWFFGDGTQAVGLAVTHEFDTNGVYVVRARASDVENDIFSDSIRVEVGMPPEVVITGPVDGASFRALDSVLYSAVATDADGSDEDVKYSWRGEFLHGTHTHPAFGPVFGASSSYFIESRGHDYHDETGYRITVTAEDVDGLTSEASTVIWPEKVQLTFDTEPSGIPILLDGLERPTPFVYDTMVGFEHDLEVPEKHCLDGQRFAFSSWSDGGSRSRLLVAPTQSVTIVAQFTADGLCNPLVEDGLALHLEASRGVTVGPTGVTSWDDLTDNDNDLDALGEPTLVPGVLSGFDVIEFDGVDDSLQRIGNLTGLPEGDEPRSIFMVARFDGAGWGGFTYGALACDEAYGIGVDPAGDAMVAFWCNDLRTSISLNNGAWQLLSSVRAGNFVEFWLDTFRIGTLTNTIDTSTDLMRIGRNLDGTFHVPMQVAEILVYDRDLDFGERRGMQEYLRRKYFPQVASPMGTRWLGTTSEDWDDPTNWSVGVPTPTLGATISGGTPFAARLTSSQARTSGRLIVESGATLELEPGSSLKVTGGAYLEGATLGTGTLILDGEGNLEAVGPITYDVEIETSGIIRARRDLVIEGQVTLQAGELTLGGRLESQSEWVQQGGMLTALNAGAMVVAPDVRLIAGTIDRGVEVTVENKFRTTSGCDFGGGTLRLTGTSAELISLDAEPFEVGTLLVEGFVILPDDFDLVADVFVVASGAQFDVGSYTLSGAVGSTNVAGLLIVRADGVFSLATDLLVTGSLALYGLPGQPASLIGDHASSIEIEGVLSANEFVVDSPGPLGFHVSESASLDVSPFDLRAGTFRNPSPTQGAVLLSIDRTLDTELRRLDFEGVTDELNFNVTTSGPGKLQMIRGQGDSVGPDLELDPNDLVDWRPMYSRLSDVSLAAGPEQVELEWMTAWTANASDFQVERLVGGTWTPVESTPSDELVETYSAIETGLTADQAVSYRLLETVTGEPALEHGVWMATPWSATVPPSIVTVGPNGAFADVETAIAQATGSELILRLEPGTIPAFTIDGASAPTYLEIQGASTTVDTSLRGIEVKNVAAGAFVGLSSLWMSTPGANITVRDCPGLVVVDGLRARDAALVFENAERLVMHASEFPGNSTGVIDGTTDAVFTKSHVPRVFVEPQASLTSVELEASVSVRPLGVYDTLSGVMPSVSNPRAQRIGVSGSMRLEGEPNRIWVLATSALPAWTRFPNPTLELPLLLDPTSYFVRDIGVFDESGRSEFSFVLAPSSASIGKRFSLQFAELNPAIGGLRFSNLSSILGLP